MTFATDITKHVYENNDHILYFLSKDIDQYFVSGFATYGNSTYAFKCIYDNGITFSEDDERHTNIAVCSAGMIGMPRYSGRCTLFAVLIYPAKYGDIYIS